MKHIPTCFNCRDNQLFTMSCDINECQKAFMVYSYDSYGNQHIQNQR